MSRLFPLLIVLLLTGLAGCGGEAETDMSRFKLDHITPEIAHANSMRSLIESLQHQLKTEGVRGLQTELKTIDERLEEFSPEQYDGPDRKTYDKLITDLKALAAEAKSSSPNRAELNEMLSSLETTVSSLPKADAAPTGNS
jgi:hypothetical protein